jgi:hypothetical protein
MRPHRTCGAENGSRKLKDQRPVRHWECVSVSCGGLPFGDNEFFNLIADLIRSLDLRSDTLSHDLLPFLSVAVANERVKHHGLDIVGAANHGQQGMQMVRPQVSHSFSTPLRSRRSAMFLSIGCGCILKLGPVMSCQINKKSVRCGSPRIDCPKSLESVS